jgi:hypothetical protein
MRNHKCGCNNRGCNQCCPKKNAAGPTGAIGPTGPGGATGATGPAGPTSDEILFAGRLTVDDECNLALFAGTGIASMVGFSVTPTARGWQILSEPLPQAVAQNLIITLGHAIFPFGPLAEAPPVYPVVIPQGIVPVGDGTFQSQFTVVLLDGTTGSPIDPCCAFFTVIPFSASLGGAQLIIDTSIAPPTCQAPPAPGLTAASSSLEERFAGRARAFNGN